jgi:hypothetical protein
MELGAANRLTDFPSIWVRAGELSKRRAASAILSFGMPIAAVLVWALSLPGFDLRAMNDLGLISVLPPAFIGAIVLLTCSFCLALGDSPLRGPVLLLHLGILILILYGTPALVEATPRLSVTWRHIGLIDYVMHNRNVLPKFDAYFNWPGFFAFGAFVTQISGLPSLISLAAWAHVFFNALYLAPLVMIYRSITKDSRVVWLGVWFFYLSNWVGQDYFSPQGFDYFLYLALLGILLGWFRSDSGDVIPLNSIRTWLPRVAPRLFWLIEGHRDDQVKRLSSPWQRFGLMAAAIAIYAAMVPSHQLTPFTALLCVGLLVVFNRIEPHSLPILMAAIALSWTCFMAVAYFAGHLDALVATIGAVDQNVQRGVVDRLRGSPDHLLVVHARLAMSAAVITLAVSGTFRRFIAGYRDVSMVLLVIAPAFLILAQYGGEMFLRVYFYALPGLAFFSAAFFFPAPPLRQREAILVRSVGRVRIVPLQAMMRRPVRIRASRNSSWLTTSAIALASLALIGGFFLTRYGNERMDYFTPQEVQAVRYLYGVAPPGSQFVAPGISEPWQFQGYTTYRTVWLENKVVREANVAALEQRMSKNSIGSYLLITRSAAATLELYAGMTPETLARFEQAVESSGRFTIIYQNPDAKVYMFINASPREERR